MQANTVDTTTVQLELVHDHTASKLLSLCLEERNSIVKKGFEYKAREDEFARSSRSSEEVISLRCKVAELCSQLSAEREAKAHKDEASASLWKEHCSTQVQQVRAQYDAQCAGLHAEIHRLSSGMERALLEQRQLLEQGHAATMKAVHLEAQGQVQHATQQLKSAVDRASLIESQLDDYREKYKAQFGSSETPVNVTKGNAGEQRLRDVLLEDLPHVTKMFDGIITDVSKGSGHSADLCLQCNGMYVLIEVKNSEHPIRKKDIEKTKRDLRDNPHVSLLVMISWGSVFQDKTIQESEVTYEQLQAGQFIAFIPCFRDMVDDGRRLILAHLICTYTGIASLQERGGSVDVNKVLEKLEGVRASCYKQVEYSEKIIKLSKSQIIEANKTVQHTLVELQSIVESASEPTTEKDKEKDGPLDVADEMPTSITEHAHTPVCHAAASAPHAPTPSKRKKSEIHCAAATLQERLKASGPGGMTLNDMVSALCEPEIAAKVGYSSTQRHWDTTSIRKQLLKRVEAVYDVGISRYVAC